MALATNSLYRNLQAKQEEEVDLDKQIARLEEDIRKLKINFGIYFNGGINVRRLNKKLVLESIIKRISDDRTLTYAQRYRFNALASRFTSYRELWRRLLKRKVWMLSRKVENRS